MVDFTTMKCFVDCGFTLFCVEVAHSFGLDYEAKLVVIKGCEFDLEYLIWVRDKYSEISTQILIDLKVVDCVRRHPSSHSYKEEKSMMTSAIYTLVNMLKEKYAHTTSILKLIIK